MRPVVSPSPARRRTAAVPVSGAENAATVAYTAPALEKGLDILEVLERRGYVARHGDGGYRLTLRLFELAHQHPPLKRLLTVALPAMQELAGVSRQSAHLVVHFARRILVVAQVDSPEPMGFGVRLGANFPFRPDRASSRVLSAFQPRAMQDELIAELA